MGAVVLGEEREGEVWVGVKGAVAGGAGLEVVGRGEGCKKGTERFNILPLSTK